MSNINQSTLFSFVHILFVLFVDWLRLQSKLCVRVFLSFCSFSLSLSSTRWLYFDIDFGFISTHHLVWHFDAHLFLAGRAHFGSNLVRKWLGFKSFFYFLFCALSFFCYDGMCVSLKTNFSSCQVIRKRRVLLCDENLTSLEYFSRRHASKVFI